LENWLHTENEIDSMAIDNATSRFDDMSVAERILLVEEIWDSVASQQEPLEMSDSRKQELRRRRQEYRDSPASTESWESVKRELRDD
jgi:putative addiction module component (TIGR02574 family)